MGDVTIYAIDGFIHPYRKVDSTDFAVLKRRHDTIVKGKRFKAAFPLYPSIVVEKGHGGGSYAHYYSHYGPAKNRGWMISLGGNRNEVVLLHEMAHIIARKHPQYGHTQGHGPGFASAFVDVVRVVLGAEAAKAMRHGLRHLRVRLYSPTSAKGVLPRCSGEPPEKVAPVLARYMEVDERAKKAKAAMREVLSVLPSMIDNATYALDCPLCGGAATVEVFRYARYQVSYTVTCHEHQKRDERNPNWVTWPQDAPCTYHDSVRRSQKDAITTYWAERRAAAR